MSEYKPAPPLERQGDDGERALPGRNLDESPLAWLARRKDKDGAPMISEAEFKAGERLREDFTFAQMSPNVTANWSLLLSEGSGKSGSPDHGAQLSDHVHAARERVRRALKAAGPEMADVLIDVCCFLQGLEMIERRHRWPQRSGKHFLRIALRQLARHYGILSDADPRIAAPRRINHWGAEGYRPKSSDDV
jgi:enamine deaminase RidA (YjgF/YER057c/UK114 family)